ncbi:MAG: hypothetical protein GX131_15135 [candidate division WS1 bacterium]|jgi:4-amino-4-deoxy-L-arabinose transferase-like glycosyltransferase|nr:hypothetical protein [candidate division WS1 bacterium]
MRPDDQSREIRRKLLIAAMLFAFIALVYLIFNVSRFEMLTDVNALDYAQVARHVARGEGFETSFIKPLGLTYETSIENHPELTYPPLHIAWTAALMRMLGENDRAASHSSGLAFLLTMPLLLLLGLRLFDWRTAVLGTFLFGTQVANLGYAITGLETCMLGLWIAGLLLLLYQASENETRELWWVGAAGLAMGLIYMTKYVWIAAAIPVIVYLIVMRPKNRLLRVIVFVGVLAVVSAPWLYRNYVITGNPFFTLRVHELVGQTRAYPANTIYRVFTEEIPSYIVFVGGNPRAIFEKIRMGINTSYGTFHSLAGVFVTPFFLVGIMVRLGNEKVERLRYVLYGMLVIVTLVLALFIAAPRLIAPLSGFVTILSAALFWRLLDARTQMLEPQVQTRWTVIAVAALIILHLHPFVTSITPDEPGGIIGETPLELAMTQVSQTVDGPVLTDIPWTVSWMAEVDAVWVPQTEGDFHRMEDAVGRFEWLLLSPTVARMAAPERLEMWANAWVQAQQGEAEHLGFVISARLGDGRWILMRREGNGPSAEVAPPS